MQPSNVKQESFKELPDFSTMYDFVISHEEKKGGNAKARVSREAKPEKAARLAIDAMTTGMPTGRFHKSILDTLSRARKRAACANFTRELYLRRTS